MTEKEMNKRTFSIKEALGFGWETAKENLGFFVMLLLVAALIYLIPWSVALLLSERGFLWSSMGVSMVDFVLTAIIWMGIIKISLNFYDKKESEIEDIVSPYYLFFKYLLASIVYFIIVILGFVLFIVPGIYLAIRLWFFDYFIIDKEMGPLDSLKSSFHATKGNVLKLLLFLILMGVINILGVLLLVIGLFITIPVTILASVFAYRKLSEQIAITKGTDS